jgi:hypothetical protein
MASLEEVVGTLVGNQVPGLIKSIHDSWLQGPFLSRSQVLLQLLKAGYAQNDSVPVGDLEREWPDFDPMLPTSGSSHPLLSALLLPRLWICVIYLSLCYCSMNLYEHLTLKATAPGPVIGRALEGWES